MTASLKDFIHAYLENENCFLVHLLFEDGDPFEMLHIEPFNAHSLHIIKQTGY